MKTIYYKMKVYLHGCACQSLVYIKLDIRVFFFTEKLDIRVNY